MRVIVATCFCLVAAVSCGGRREDNVPVSQYDLAGTVVRLDAETRLAVINHQTIKDRNGGVWMEAMTMEFPVKDAREFAKLRPGAAITARVLQRPTDSEFWIDTIRVRSPAGDAGTRRSHEPR